MADFFAELKRRHIYRVAAAYAVVAWVLLQLFNNLEPILKLPEWTGMFVLVLLVGGFPVALLFVWMHQLAPADGATARATASKLDWALIGGLGVVIALMAYQQLALSPAVKTAQQEQATVTAARAASVTQAGAVSIAVLPFANLSADPEQEFFSDGMTDEISGALSKIADLRVVGRASSFQYKKRDSDLRAIGQALGATHLIEGSVRKAGNRVRISAELVQADNGLQVWSENYDRDLTDVFAIQEDIAQAIAMSLRMPLGLKPGQNLVNSRIKDEPSHEEYLRAKALVRTRTSGPGAAQGLKELTEAVKRLDQVVANDPEFAPAWALQGLAYGYIPFRHPALFAGDRLDEARAVVADALSKGEAAASRAIMLDPKNADGYVALGLIQHARGKQILAGDAFSKAMALDPTNSDGLHLYSDFLADMGYVKKALPLRQQLLALEPFVPIFLGVTHRIMYAAGQYDEVIKTGVPYNVLALAAKGQYGKAADDFLKFRGLPPATLDAAAQVLRSAPAVAPPETLQRLRLGRIPSLMTFIYVYVGAPERVMDFYEDGLKFGYVGPGDNVYLWPPSYAPVRKTARFKAYMRAVGIVDFWRKNGWPDLCRPVGTDDFVCD